MAAGKEFGADKVTRLSAALSFFTLFSMVPLLFLVLAVVGFVSSDSVFADVPCGLVMVSSIPAETQNPVDQIILQVDDVAGRAVSRQLANLTCEASNYAPQSLVIGIALVAFSASTIFLHIQGVLNFLFHAPDEHTRGVIPMLVQRGVALVSALVLSILVLTPVVAVASINFLRDLVDVTWLRRLLGIGVPLTSLLLMVTVVTLTFRVLTQAPVPWQAARRGGLFTALSTLLGAFLVGAYLSSDLAGEGALGAVGGVAILLFFFNLMWMIYLFGVEVTKVYADYLAFGDVVPPSERAERSSFELAEQGPAPEEAENRSVEPPWRSGMVAFLVGLVTGWAARRRDS